MAKVHRRLCYVMVWRLCSGQPLALPSAIYPGPDPTMDEEDIDYRELLLHQTPEQRNIQRLEWRWTRRLPKWERATVRVQAWYRYDNK